MPEKLKVTPELEEFLDDVDAQEELPELPIGTLYGARAGGNRLGKLFVNLAAIGAVLLIIYIIVVLYKGLPY